jgi:hypothetical protein
VITLTLDNKDDPNVFTVVLSSGGREITTQVKDQEDRFKVLRLAIDEIEATMWREAVRSPTRWLASRGQQARPDLSETPGIES